MADNYNRQLVCRIGGCGGGVELDDMDECEIQRIGNQDEDDDEFIQVHASSAASPERWDVLGLGQAMVSFCFL